MASSEISSRPLPRSLKTRTGRLRRYPAEVSDVVRCPECKTPFEYSDVGWGCPKVLGHVKIIKDELLEERIAERLKATKSRWKAKNIVKHLKRYQRWLFKRR
jgi:hypothetical protein